MQKCAYGLLKLKPWEFWEQMGPDDFMAMMDGWEFGRETERAENDRLLFVARQLTYEVHRALGGKALKKPSDLILLTGENRLSPEEERVIKRAKSKNLFKKAKKRGSI